MCRHLCCRLHATHFFVLFNNTVFKVTVTTNSLYKYLTQNNTLAQTSVLAIWWKVINDTTYGEKVKLFMQPKYRCMLIRMHILAPQIFVKRTVSLIERILYVMYTQQSYIHPHLLHLHLNEREITYLGTPPWIGHLKEGDRAEFVDIPKGNSRDVEGTHKMDPPVDIGNKSHAIYVFLERLPRY